MEFKLSISLNEDQMRTPSDLSHSLDVLADEMLRRTAGDPFEPVTIGPNIRIAGNVRDINGNTVGHWQIIDDPTPEDTRYAIFGRGVHALMDGEEWDSTTTSAIGELATTLNLPFREPQYDDEGE